MRPLVQFCTCVPFFLAACQTTAYPDARIERADTVEVDGKYTTMLVDFEEIAAQQKEDSWCWAACAEMILRYNEIATSQKEIASRIHGENDRGEALVQGASLYEILCALNPDMEHRPFEVLWERVSEEIKTDPSLVLGVKIKMDLTKVLRSVWDKYDPPTMVAVEDLRNGHPAIAGLHDLEDKELGHAYVLVGAEYTVSETSNFFVRAFDASATVFKSTEELAEEANKRVDQFPSTLVTLVDPWTGELVELTGEQFAERVDFVITRRQARETLEKWHNIARLEESK